MDPDTDEDTIASTLEFLDRDGSETVGSARQCAWACHAGAAA
jgi:hypothetical protein